MIAQKGIFPDRARKNTFVHAEQKHCAKCQTASGGGIEHHHTVDIAPILGYAGAFEPVLKSVGEISEGDAILDPVQPGELIQDIKNLFLGWRRPGRRIASVRNPKIFSQQGLPSRGVFLPRRLSR